jgi:hypothetical protein
MKKGPLLIKYRKLKGWKYELMEPVKIRVLGLPEIDIEHPYIILSGGLLIIRQGYAWDGASGVPDNPDNMRASAVHDALYQLMRLGLLDRKHKNYADKLLRQICIEDGMNAFWADIIFNGVQAFGSGAIKPDKHPKGEVVEIYRLLNA